MTFPTEPVPVPDVVTRIAAGRTVIAVWVNELGGTTFAIDSGAEYVKWDPVSPALAAELPRLRWAAAFTAVPRVVASGPGWLHTAGLAGRSAVDPRWTAEPRTAARAIGVGLRRLHDALPVPGCPFGRPAWVPADAPAADRLVVCHGDACAPNTLLADDGEFAGHVDLGDLGVADRWADLAIATLSLGWNYPTGGQERSDPGKGTGGQERSDPGKGTGDFQSVLLDAYGVAPDVDRIAYYRRAWDAFDEGLDPPAG